MRFSVWAPAARTVQLELNGSRYELPRTERGWWAAEVEASPGDDYAYRVDGEGPFPDPRSPWQPEGPDGPSRVVDHSAFAWSDRDWKPAVPLGEWVIYELHIGTFTAGETPRSVEGWISQERPGGTFMPGGTFDSAVERLDHLVELGVDAVELCPVNEFSGSHGWGYDGVDLWAPHHAYGGPEGLKRLVDACHERGLATILDVVYNHLGPAGNYLGWFGPYFTDAYSTPWGDAVNFDDAYSDEVRNFFIENALMWLRDYHFDALRLDAVHAMLDQSAVHFLEEMAVRVDELEAATRRPLYLIAESDLNDPRVVRARDDHGYGIDAQWSDDFHHALHAVLTGERNGYYSDFGTIADLAKALEQAFVYDGRYSEHRERRHGRRPEGLDGHDFLAYMQNHDQIGNRAAGERISHLVDPELVKVGAALVLMSPFIPMLFQGEEWAASSPFQYFTDHRDRELGRAVSEGRRSEFGSFGWKPEDVPDPQDRATFERSKLNWDELSEDQHRDMLEWYRALLALRRAEPELRSGDLDQVRVEFDEAQRWLKLWRGSITAWCDLADTPREQRPVGDVLLRSQRVSIERSSS